MRIRNIIHVCKVPQICIISDLESSLSIVDDIVQSWYDGSVAGAENSRRTQGTCSESCGVCSQDEFLGFNLYKSASSANVDFIGRSLWKHYTDRHVA